MSVGCKLQSSCKCTFNSVHVIPCIFSCHMPRSTSIVRSDLTKQLICVRFSPPELRNAYRAPRAAKSQFQRKNNSCIISSSSLRSVAIYASGISIFLMLGVHNYIFARASSVSYIKVQCYSRSLGFFPSNAPSAIVIFCSAAA